MIRLISLIASILIVEMIFFGPIGLTVYDVSIRKVLIGLLIVMAIVPLLTQRSIATWQLGLVMGIILYLVIWAGAVPIFNGVSLKMTIAEAQPIVAILLIFPFYYLFLQYGAEPYLKIVRICVMVMAAIVIVVWLASNVLGSVGTGLAMREFYINLNDSETGIYIGPLADGSFRVMLINFILFPLMLCYYNWQETDLQWSAFYGVAIFATGTRAFLLVWALIVGVSILRRRPLLAVPAIGVAIGVMAMYAGDLQRLRVFEFSSELTSESARYVQFFSLISLFLQHPILGAGLGANAILIRSIEAPYSYELTYVALLAKLGIVGSGIVVTAMTVWVARLMKGNPNWPSIVSLLVAIVLMTATNPYLINLVGMTIAAFVIALGITGGNSGGAPAGRRAQSHGGTR